MGHTAFLVEGYMTASPITIEATDSVEHARSVMTRAGVRHLPVMRSGELVGILSEREITGALGIRAAETNKLQVGDICSPGAEVTVPGAFLKDVAQRMAERHIGSVVVMQQKNVAGILTTTDLARALAAVLTP